VPSKYAQIAGDAVHFLHTGPTSLPGVPPALERGALFVFVHGAGRNAGDFRGTLAALEPEHSAVAIDLPGHGRSTGIDALASVEAYADVVERFAAAVLRRSFVLVGWSMGAQVVLAAASRGLPRLAGLVLISGAAVWTLDPAMLAAQRDVVRGRRPQIFDKTLFSPATAFDVMREAWTEQVKTDPRVLYGDLSLAQRFDARTILASIHLPALVVQGADDRLTAPGQAEALARGLSAARLVVLERAGHFPLLEQPERTHELLTSFAAGLA